MILLGNMKFIGQVKDFFLDLLFPIECLGCGKEKVWLCEDCLEKISLNETRRSKDRRILTIFILTLDVRPDNVLGEITVS